MTNKVNLYFEQFLHFEEKVENFKIFSFKFLQISGQNSGCRNRLTQIKCR